jgi:alkanesulfonate monooxygenase SsuD/methylene tetrahydromethanopterin reductase-like flavin-dependent oxidoreductase (luciferase family)
MGPLLEQGLSKRSDGRTLKDLDITAIPHITLMDDVRQAMDKEKPGVALYVGGMGAKGKNFHKEKMAAAGFPEAAERIQELYLAGRKEEAAQAVPDEYIDLVGLMGPAERIRERWKPWADSGANRFVVMHPTREVVELLGTFI